MRKLSILTMWVLLLLGCKEKHSHYNGYIDADLTYLSSNYAGRLAQLFFYRGDQVQKNQLLFKLEQTSEQLAMEMSQLSSKQLLSQKQEILDQIHYNEMNYRRTLQMQKQHAASQNDLDVAKRELDVSNHQLAAINYQIESSQNNTSDKQWQLTRKENFATDDGIIFDTYFTKDEYVQAGQPILSLITKENIKAIFYVPETALSQIAINQSVNLSTDGRPKFATGKIRFISNVAQYTPPILYSREEREALIFRVEASIDSPNLNQIHLGQPVTLDIVR